MSAKSFTARQGRYLAFIDAYTRVHGRPPAETDMQRHFQLSPPSVHQMVLTLERLGYIRRRAPRPRRLARSPSPPTGQILCAEELVGFVHYRFHRNTAMIEPVCYLQDLFTAPSARGRGIGRNLIEAVYAAAEAAGSSRVYWLTHETNAGAMVLYDKVADRSGFTQYRKQLR